MVAPWSIYMIKSEPIFEKTFKFSRKQGIHGLILNEIDRLPREARQEQKPTLGRGGKERGFRERYWRHRPKRRKFNTGASEGNRTLVTCLGSRSTAIVLHSPNQPGSFGYQNFNFSQICCKKFSFSVSLASGSSFILITTVSSPSF